MLPTSPSRRFRSRPAPLVALVVAVLLTASGAGSAFRIAPAAADGVNPPPLPDITFFGRGYGHGVGMSQYGARGRALVGQLAPAILAHYFPKTTLLTRSATTTVRVLLLNAFAATPASPLTIVGKLSDWTIDGIAKTFPADARVTLAPTASGAATWALKVVSATGTVLHTTTVSGDVYVRPVSANTVLQLASKATATNIYRGFFRVHLATTAIVVNHIAIDRYLRGVVPVEMPSTWPTEALKAQTIAARSYALRRIHSSSGLYDLYDDTRSQVYRGWKAEAATTTAAITATSAVTLMSGTAIVNALFHSADGGWTENNENVYVSPTGAIVSTPVSYLRGSSDRAPDATSYDKASPYATWKTATYTAAAMAAILALDPQTNVGTLTAIDLSRRGVSGRLISVTLTGSLGTKTVSGGVFVDAFNAHRPVADPPLRGTLFALAPIP